MSCSVSLATNTRLGLVPWRRGCPPRPLLGTAYRNDAIRRARGIACKAKAQNDELRDSGDGPSDKENTVTISCRGERIQCSKGTLLRTALLDGGVSPHNGESKLINCRGLGTCGTCAVRIDGPVTPTGKTTKEKLRLNFLPHGAPSNENLRLACQVAVQGDLEVTKMAGFWGSSADEVSSEPASEFRKPFGDLEYILDTVSKNKKGNAD